MDMTIFYVVITAVSLWIVSVIPAIFQAAYNCANIIPISAEDFLRLVSQQPNTKIFFKMTPFGCYRYFSGINGTQIYTKTKERLPFPDHGELILIQNHSRTAY